MSKQEIHTELGSPEHLNQLIQMFPSHDVTLLKDALDNSAGSINDAVTVIVGDEGATGGM